ncbi:phosphatidylinositol-specific phospholipase C domain-containing protein [Streptacidiphilus monticola]
MPRLRPALTALSALALGLGALLPASTPAVAQPSGSTGAFNSLTGGSHPDWMASVPDATGLATLSLPGTHDTLAIHGGLAPWAYEAQEDHGDGAQTLTAQLLAGIRVVDIRVRVVDGGTAFAIHHTDVYQNANFDDVLTRLAAFLADHPRETVLLNLHGECDGDSTEGGSGSSSIGHCADDPGDLTADQRQAVFRGYLARYPGLFWAPGVTGSSTAATPALSQVRGHVVLTAFTGPRGEVYPGYGLTDLTTGDWGRYVENDYQQCDLGAKWSEVQANLDRASADTSGHLWTTYTSANCAPFGAGPADVAGATCGARARTSGCSTAWPAERIRAPASCSLTIPGTHSSMR